jgi:fluoride exporter
MPRPALSWTDAALVFAGGAAGTVLRTLLLLPTAPWWQTWGLLVVNVAGALALGLLTGVMLRRGASERDRRVRLLLGTGLLGGFTTYSALAVHAASPPWFWTAVLTVVLGVIAAFAGLRLGRGGRTA